MPAQPLTFRRGARAALAVAAVLLFAPGTPPIGRASAAEGDKPAAGDAAKPAAPRRPAAPVRLTTAKTQAMPVVLDLVGNAQAIASIPVKTRVDSQIETVGVQEGDRVKAGQVIFTLDSRAIRAQAAQARAVLARDEAQLALVRSDLERTEQLVASRTKSSRDLESARTLVAAQEATIDADKAALENLEVQATYCTIRSPIDGRVGSIPLKPGSSIRAADSTVLATINQLDPIYVAVSVPQAMVTKLRSALAAGEVPVEVRRPDGSGGTLSGRIAFTENALDATSGTLGVKARVDNPEERLLPGEFVQVRLKLDSQADALVVPETAIQLGQNGTYVWAIGAEGTAEARRIAVDRTVDGLSVVTSGLKAGDRVVIEGQLRLAPGATVEVLPEPAKSGKTGS